MEQFVEEHPTSIERNSAYINVADYYFGNSKFSQARKWYDKVDLPTPFLPEKRILFGNFLRQISHFTWPLFDANFTFYLATF